MRRWERIAAILLSVALAAAAVPQMWAEAASLSQEKKTQETLTVELSGNSAAISNRSTGTSKSAKVRLTLGSGQETPKYNAGAKVKLALKVKNEGTMDAQDVRITPVIDDAKNWPFEIDRMNYEQNLKTVKAGAQTTASWEMAVRSDVESKAYKTTFCISYEDETGEHTQDKYIYIKAVAKETAPKDEQTDAGNSTPPEAGGVYNDEPAAGDTGNASIPRVIVTGFKTEPAAVKAGENFRLIVHVKNTSAVTAVSNMLFDFEAPTAGTDAAAEAPAFLPVSGASSVYLDGISAQGTKDISIDLNARADLVQKPYSITVSMMYEGGNAVQYESSSSVAIPVQQDAKFELSTVEVGPTSIQVGEQANVMCSLYNTGKVKLYNVKVQFVGDGISADEVFVGNIESGATGIIDGMVLGESETMGGMCKMIISYENESGNVSKSEEEFALEVVTATDEDMENFEYKEESEKSFPVVPVVIAVVIVIAVAAVIIIRARKKKRALMEEEDLADEVDRFTEDE